MINESIKYENTKLFSPKQGKCEWCERHNQSIRWVVGETNGIIWTMWLCDSCRECNDLRARWLNNDWRKDAG